MAGLIFCADCCNIFHIGNRPFCFLSIRMFTGVALTISFKDFSFILKTLLTLWHKRPGFQPVQILACLSHQA